MFIYFVKATWFFLVFQLVWLVGNITFGDENLFVRLVNYFTPWVLLLTSILIIGSLFAKTYCRLSFFILVFALLSFPYVKYFFRDKSFYNLSSEKSLSILTYSVMGRNKDYEAIAGVIKDNLADIVFLQEVSDLPQLLFYLKDLYGYGNKLYFVDGFLPIISRFPLTKVSTTGSLNAATVYIKNKKHVLYNIHATKSFSSNTMYALQKLPIFNVIEASKNAELPVIVAGDFNATEMSDVYRAMLTVFFNSHDEAGRGFGFTFPSPERNIGQFFKFIRIDHIFYNPFYTAISSYTINDNGRSDHYPVFARLIERYE